MKISKCFTIFLSLLLIHAENGLANDSKHFDASKEFVNYFDEIVRKEGIVKTQALLEQALSNIFENLELPIVEAGKSSVSKVKYFSYLEHHLTDAGAEIYPSAGVVRSALGYIYAEMRDGATAQHPTSPESTLIRLSNNKSPIPAQAIRGVGSDFDLLVTNAKDLGKTSSEILAITNSAEAHYGLTNDTSPEKRAIFGVGDVKAYDKQITRAVNQGGSTLDFLAFDLRRKHLIEPGRLRGRIVSSFLNGQFEYLAPIDPNLLEQPAKQAVRGLRPLLELPFLSVKDDTVLRHDLERFIQQVKDKKPPKDLSAALEQFGKAVRNSRWGGAHNRVYRATSGSIEETYRNLNEQLRNKSDVPIPEFVGFDSINDRKLVKNSLEALPDELLMPVPEFLSNYTNDGKLFHRTRDISSALAISRGGLIRSPESNVKFGSGAYTAVDKAVADKFGGVGGLTLTLDIDAHKKLRILDWDKVSKRPEIIDLVKKAKADGKDLFKMLSEEYKIDLIIRRWDSEVFVLVQNSAAIRIPNGALGAIKNLGSSLKPFQFDDKFRDWGQNASVSRLGVLEKIQAYDSMYRYASDMGETGLPEPKELLRDFYRRADIIFAESNLKDELLLGTQMNAVHILQANHQHTLARLINEAPWEEIEKVYDGFDAEQTYFLKTYSREMLAQMADIQVTTSIPIRNEIFDSLSPPEILEMGSLFDKVSVSMSDPNAVIRFIEACGKTNQNQEMINKIRSIVLGEKGLRNLLLNKKTNFPRLINAIHEAKFLNDTFKSSLNILLPSLENQMTDENLKLLKDFSNGNYHESSCFIEVLKKVTVSPNGVRKVLQRKYEYVQPY